MSEENLEQSSENPAAIFNAAEARVFACLIEKHLATPNNYPLTINSLMNACNQKSNREPVMNLTEGQVGHTVNTLKERDYVRVDLGERANKITHRAPGMFNITREEMAVLCMLMLRTPLTLNDIKARTERMTAFEDIAAVKTVVDGLIDRDQPLVVLIPKGAGRREDRYTHLLCGEPEFDLSVVTAPPATTGNNTDLQQQLAALEARINRIEIELGINKQPE